VHANARVLGALAIGIGVVALVAYLLVAAAVNRDSYDSKVKSFPHTEQDCAKIAGNWTHGPFGESICERVTADAGKDCRSAADCEGACVAEERVGGQVTSGRCSSRLHVYGCITLVEKSGAYRVCHD
jgi:hypothetical protein